MELLPGASVHHGTGRVLDAESGQEGVESVERRWSSVAVELEALNTADIA